MPPDLTAVFHGGDSIGVAGDPSAARTLSRRDILRGALAGGAAATLSSLLAACGGSASPGTAATPTGGSPKYGGTLTIGLLGGGLSDTVDADKAVAYPDAARVTSLYDPLATFAPDMSIEYRLAEEISPTSSAATSWLIRLRPGVEFHDGKTVTSADIKYTLQRIADPKVGAVGASMLSVADVKNVKILDSKSLIVPMNFPVSVFDEILATPPVYNMVPVGYDPRHPIGSGPFKYKSFTPGQRSVFTRNANYWEQGKPYLDELVLIDVATDTARINGITSGQFDGIDQVPPVSVPQLAGGSIRTIVSKGFGWNPFTMRVDTAPFNDVRVRQAMRLIAARPQELDVAMGGYGRIGNDLFAPFDPTFDHSLPQRVQDIEQAKHLLQAAGRSGLSVELVTSDQIGAGILQTAQVFAQNAAAAGVSVSIRNLTQTEFYGPNYLKWVFAQDDWAPVYYLGQVYFSMLPTSVYSETHFNDPTYTKLAKQALATVDVKARSEIVHEMQTIEWNTGGYIVPFFTGIVDAVRPNVQGVLPGETGYPFRGYRFKDVWLT